MTERFPLERWFDLSRPISKEDADLTEAQMALYAVKQGIDPSGPDAKREYRAMRAAVKRHNQTVART